jgi:hypothetical protein
VRLAVGLEDRIEGLMAMHVSAPQYIIRRQAQQIKKLQEVISKYLKFESK